MPQKHSPFQLPEMELVEKRLQEINTYDNPWLSEVTGYVLHHGGKRLRPLLVLLCSDIYGAALKPRVDVAVAAELIHSASLVHDDIVDNSSLRRGQPSTNKRWGNPSAVLVGDFLFARAYAILSNYPAVLGVMTEAIASMCLGELRQMYCHFDPETTPEEYVLTIVSKTASLITASCESGALISSMPAAEVKILIRFALHTGIAYQIADDISDYVLEAVEAGKPQGSDIRNGVVTLPLMYLLVNPDTRQRVHNLLSQKQPLEPKMLRQELEHTKAIQKAAVVACQHLDRGIELLNNFPPGPAVLLLEELARQVQERCTALSQHASPAQQPSQPCQAPCPQSGPS